MECGGTTFQAKALTQHIKATVSLWFLQQAFFGLRLLGERVECRPMGGIINIPDLRLGFDNRQVDGFGFAGG